MFSKELTSSPHFDSLIKSGCRSHLNLCIALCGWRLLRPSHIAAKTKMVTITMQRECILLVEMLHAKHIHTHSTKRGCAFLSFSFSFSFSFSLSMPVWPGLNVHVHTDSFGILFRLQTLGFVILLSGVCYRLLKPMKAAANRKSKKKKGGATVKVWKKC